jgi:hypothetical protein
MCLIITGKSSQVRATLLETKGMLKDIYTSNSDGIGYMYGTKDGLKVVKFLPKSMADAEACIKRMPNDDRDIAIHFRMTTHGDTDLTNCHPYDVVPGYVAMMHNGVLHTGNKADVSKSDTWHFIKDYLASPIAEHPDMIFNDSFLTMVADFIANNRFVFMNGEGRMSHVNFDQGVEHDGMWFSNTYAWRPSALIPNYYMGASKGWRGNGYGYSAYDDADDYDYDYTYDHKHIGNVKLVSAHHAAYKEDDYEWTTDEQQAAGICQAIHDIEVDAVSAMMNAYPDVALPIVFAMMVPSESKYNHHHAISAREKYLIDLIIERNVEELIEYAYSTAAAPQILAEVLCYYCDWTGVEESV